MIKFKFAFNWKVVDIRLGLLVSLSKCHRLVFDADFAISSLNTVDYHDTFLLFSRDSDGLFLFKDEHAWLIIIKDGDSGDSIISHQSLICILIVQLDIKIFVGLPAVIINYLN